MMMKYNESNHLNLTLCLEGKMCVGLRKGMSDELLRQLQWVSKIIHGISHQLSLAIVYNVKSHCKVKFSGVRYQ